MEENHAHKKGHRKMMYKAELVFCVASLLWFLFRTGSKPSRIVYPCQRATLTSTSLMLGAIIPISLATALVKTEKFMLRRWQALLVCVLAVNLLLGSEQFFASSFSTNAVNPNKEIQLELAPRNATTIPASDIFVVNGRANAYIAELIDLLGSGGTRFFKSSSNGQTSGPDGLIACDDVVLIKINEQWNQRGGTNTDLLKQLIQSIVDHPDGFVGEIVVADNGQSIGRMDWPQSNAEDIYQSTQDVVDMFSTSHNVSTFDWQLITRTQVNEYVEGNMTDGYILYSSADPETNIYVSYPKFRTVFGTYVSFKHGIWNGTGYEKRLKIINVPVLKSHVVYGVTGAVKHYMGVQSERNSYGGLANGHSTVGRGGMGTLMVETSMPTLNIMDAIWVNANPAPSAMRGPQTPYSYATRVNVLLASTDPVALDYWAAKNVLVQTARLIGYSDVRSVDPDVDIRVGVSEAFGVWLNRSKAEILAAGYNVTTDENCMNVYVYPEPVHDVAATSLTLSKRNVGQGYPLIINATAENHGGYHETFNLTIWANTTRVYQTEVVSTIGNYTSVAVTLETSDFALGDYEIQVEVDVVPGETDTADNLVSGAWVHVGTPGDINGDGIVNLTDLYSAAALFGATKGHARYSSDCDINDDGVINMVDMYIAAVHFGQTEP